MGKDKGPLFVMYDEWRQLCVGKPSQPVAVLELREDARAGDKLILTDRDLDHLTFRLDVAARGVREPEGRS